MTKEQLLDHLTKASGFARDQANYFRGGFDSLNELATFLEEEYQKEAEKEESKGEDAVPASET
jgi:hypothetical protein